MGRVVVLILFVVAAVPHVAAGDDVVLLSGYETDDGRTHGVAGSTEFRSGDAAVGKGYLRWTVPGGTERAHLRTRCDEVDLRPFGILRLRYRLKGPFDDVVWIGLRSEKGSIEYALTDSAETWKTLEVSLAGLWGRGEFDPAALRGIEFETGGSEPLVFDVDEVELVRTEAGWRGAGAGEEGFTFTVADFEGGAASGHDSSDACRSEIVTDGAGHVLRLTPQGRYPYLSTHFENVPQDLRPFRLVRLRARVVWGSGRGLEFAIYGRGGVLERELPEITEEWTTIEFPIPEMEAYETFDPQGVAGIRIAAFSSRKRVVEIDDVELVVSSTGWRYSARELIEHGLQEFAPVKRVEDFEAPDAAGRVEIEDCEVARVPVRRKRGNGTGFALKWTVPEEPGKASLILRQIPRDLSDYRILRFVARADRKTDADVQIRLESLKAPFNLPLASFGDRGSLAFDVEGFDRNWKAYELLLPEAHRLGTFDAGSVIGMRFSRIGPIAIYLDRIELVKGGGGCLRTEREDLVHRFGEKRAPEVRAITTKHFRVFTDVERPDKKLGRHLETILTRARTELSLGPPVGPIDVYIHRVRDGWADPLLRKSWTVDRLAAMAGLARAGSLSTYDQDFAAPAFVEALTRAILQRSAGGGGGAWLQVGAAGFVAARVAGRRPAEVYSKTVRKRDRRPLADLLVRPRLSAEHRPMAAAFVEFLVRGPRAKRTVRGLSTLVLLDPRAPGYLDAVEATLGATVAELEVEFGEWLESAGEK